MKLFGKRKKNNPQPGKDKIAKGIAGMILKIQNGFAKFMSKHVEKVSASSLKFILIMFLLAGSGLSIYCVVEAFTKREKSKAVKIDRLSVPRYYDKNGDESTPSDFFITKKEHEEIQGFQKYMDSLHHSKKGFRIYDSIMLNRPGLLDSVNQLEELYQQQLQNKK